MITIKMLEEIITKHLERIPMSLSSPELSRRRVRVRASSMSTMTRRMKTILQTEMRRSLLNHLRDL